MPKESKSEIKYLFKANTLILVQSSIVASVGISREAFIPASTKSLTPSNLRREGSQGVFVPSQPLTVFAGSEKLFNVPLLVFSVRSIHVIFVSVLSAKLPALSIFAASKESTGVLPLDELDEEDELEEVVDPDEELEEDVVEPEELDEDEVEPLLEEDPEVQRLLIQVNPN